MKRLYLLKGGCWEKGGDFFQGGCRFYIKILNAREKSRKNQSVTEWCRCGKFEGIDELSSDLGAEKLKPWDTSNYLWSDPLVVKALDS